MNKTIKDGKVAVLYSPGFGAGWYTWNLAQPSCLFDPEIVELVQTGGAASEIEELARKKWHDGDAYFYPGGADDLVIAWLPEGTKFRIDEYDGSEILVTEDDQEWITA